MILEPEGRWPPVYDAETLAAEIRALAKAEDFDARFWVLTLDASTVFQGDVVHLVSAVPVLDENGQPALTDDCDHWLVLGNTCDFDRKLEDNEFTQLVPLVDFGPLLERSRLNDHRAYQAARSFYLPPWPGGDGHHRVADFTRPVAIHKAAFPRFATPVARTQYRAWVLLHSCLIRFLCRDDGRFT